MGSHPFFRHFFSFPDSIIGWRGKAGSCNSPNSFYLRRSRQVLERRELLSFLLLGRGSSLSTALLSSYCTDNILAFYYFYILSQFHQLRKSFIKVCSCFLSEGWGLEVTVFPPVFDGMVGSHTVPSPSVFSVRKSRRMWKRGEGKERVELERSDGNNKKGWLKEGEGFFFGGNQKSYFFYFGQPSRQVKEYNSALTPLKIIGPLKNDISNILISFKNMFFIFCVSGWASRRLFEFSNSQIFLAFLLWFESREGCGKGGELFFCLT